MNNVRILYCFAGFTVSVSLFANTPADHRITPPAQIGQGEAGIALRVIDLTGATISNVRVTVRDERGRVVVNGSTNQHGVLRLPRLAAGPYAFSVSALGTHLADFQSFLSVGPDQGAEIEIALKDRCYVDGNVHCDEFDTTPFFVDVNQQDSIVVAGPYPPLPEPTQRRRGFFRRLLSRLHHRQNGE